MICANVNVKDTAILFNTENRNTGIQQMNIYEISQVLHFRLQLEIQINGKEFTQDTHKTLLP